jgi:hypothetical protein
MYFNEFECIDLNFDFYHLIEIYSFKPAVGIRRPAGRFFLARKDIERINFKVVLLLNSAKFLFSLYILCQIIKTFNNPYIKSRHKLQFSQ